MTFSFMGRDGSRQPESRLGSSGERYTILTRDLDGPAATRPATWKIAVREHDLLLEALFARDSDGAAICMHEHLTRAAKPVFAVGEFNRVTADHLDFFLAGKARDGS